MIDVNFLNETSRYYYNKFKDTLITRTQKRLNNLVITKNMLNTSKNNNNNNHNHKLYNHILTIDDNTLKNIHFKFEGETGINAGGLTRTVYDIFYHSYIKKFFQVNDNGSFILKNITTNNKNTFITATEKLILLAKKGKVKIVIPIHETLFEILNSENPTNTINLTNQKKYNDKDSLQNKIRKNLLKNQNSKIGEVIAKNNGNTTFNMNWNTIKNNDTKNDTKKEVFLRRYLNSLGFMNYTQFEYMNIWFKTYWDNIFTHILSFTKKDFFERLKIIKVQDGNKPRQEYKLSSNSINKLLNNNTNNSLIQEYPNLKVVLNYINQEDDEYRKKFTKYITGSVYNNGDTYLLLDNKTNTNKPIHSHTCFNRLDIFKINPNESLKNHTTLTNNRFEKEFINSNNSYISN